MGWRITHDMHGLASAWENGDASGGDSLSLSLEDKSQARRG